MFHDVAKEKKMKKITLVLILSLLSFALFASAAPESKSITVISREDGSGTRGAFVELTGVLQNKVDKTVQTAEITNSTAVVITTVQGNPNAIGYISLGSLSSSVKALSVNGVYPTADAVKSGKYVIARPFNIAYKNLSDVASDFLAFVMSDNGQNIIEKKGYVRVSSGTAYEAKGISGHITISGSSSVHPVMEVLVEAYESLNPSVDITLMLSDSTTGMNDAISGNSDIGMASRELKDSEKAKLNSQAIAIDGIAVIVNEKNSVSALTVEQVRDIYLGVITDWSSLND